MRDNDDRYRGDGSADREALTRHAEDEASPRAPMPSAAEIELRNAYIKQQMRRCAIAGFRGAAAEYALGMERYYRSQWRAWRKVRGGDRVRETLRAAAALDGVRLEDER